MSFTPADSFDKVLISKRRNFDMPQRVIKKAKERL